MLFMTTTAHAQSVDIEAIADQIEASGSYLERSVTGEAEAAIGRANGNGVAFVRLDNASQSSEIAETLLAELQSRNSSYGAVVVLTNAAVFARGKGNSASALTDSITQTFGGGDIAGALDQYLANVGNDAAGGFSDSATTSGSSGGFPWIVPILLAVGAYFLFNMMRGRRKTKKEEIKTLEEDREEIIEQLKANADRVIDLGDEVIQAGDPELISIYEEASAAYQNVSNEIRNADTIAKVDVLDDQIDKAEWQFEVIEARLTGQTPPPFLDTDATPDQPAPPAPTPPAPQASPAERDAQLRRRGQQPRPLPRRNPRYQPRQQQRRSGMGGMFGKMAISVLMSMLMGGGLGQPRQSRRTQRRRSGGGYGGIQMPF